MDLFLSEKRNKNEKSNVNNDNFRLAARVY